MATNNERTPGLQRVIGSHEVEDTLQEFGYSFLDKMWDELNAAHSTGDIALSRAVATNIAGKIARFWLGRIGLYMDLASTLLTDQGNTMQSRVPLEVVPNEIVTVYDHQDRVRGKQRIEATRLVLDHKREIDRNVGKSDIVVEFSSDQQTPQVQVQHNLSGAHGHDVFFDKPSYNLVIKEGYFFDFERRHYLKLGESFSTFPTKIERINIPYYNNIV